MANRWRTAVLAFSLLAGIATGAADAQSPAPVSMPVDARTEVAAALYAASATQATAERIADQKLREQRKQIENLRTRVRAGETKLQTALAEAQEAFVAALSARDRAYAEEIAIFRRSVQDIAASPEGAAALARFNAGDEIGALAVLDELRQARDAARKKVAAIESAAAGRRIAMLALEARQHGKLGTADVIARFEEVTGLDPKVHRDWIELGRLYQDAGRLADASRAVQAAADTAVDDRDRAVASAALGDVLEAQGDGAGALAAFRTSLAIREALAARDPANTEWKRDLSVSHHGIGDVLVAQGNGAGALAAFRTSLAITEALAVRDPANTAWQRSLSVSQHRIGDVLVAQGDGPGALAAYRKGLSIHEALAARDPANTERQRDLSISHNKIGDVLVAQGDGPGVLAAYRKRLAIAEALAAYRKGLAIAEALAARDPANTEWQRDLSVSHDRIGDVLVAQGDGPGALAAYRKGLAIAEALAVRDPANAEWQCDLIVSNVKLAEATGDESFLKTALQIAEAMQSRGVLASSDLWVIADLRQRLGQTTRE